MPTPDNVTPIRRHKPVQRASEGNMKCPQCGGEWWVVSVCFDEATGLPSGWGTLISCKYCSFTKVHIR